MSNTSLLVSTLKKLLKARSVTYRDLAAKLALSEASVKRIFAREDFTVERLEQVCAAAGTDLFGLMQLAGRRSEAPQYHLTDGQEEILAGDHRLFTMLHLLLRGDQPAQIMREHKISKVECTKLLMSLERLKLIEAHPENVVRLLVPRLISWQPDGLLVAKYSETLRQHFLSSAFAGPGEMLRYVAPRVSARARQYIGRKIQNLIRDIEETVDLEFDDELPAKESFGVLIAYRPITSMLSFEVL